MYRDYIKLLFVLIAISFLLLIGCTDDAEDIFYNTLSSNSPSPTLTPEKAKLSLLIPLYSCPSDENGKIWEKVKEASDKVQIAIIWGIICEEDNYQGALKELGNKGIKRLAYISTSDSSRPLSKIDEDINFYSHYPIDGFFFDEVSNSEEKVSYIKTAISYAKDVLPSAFIVINSPYADPSFVKKVPADTVIIFENEFTDWQTFEANPYENITSTKLAALIHTTPHKSLNTAIELAEKRNIGWVYVTDKDWAYLPTYFDEEVSIISHISP